jgi:16S rRNA C967 or C1407 C5-methylase (RsmB/RsmF family)
MKKIDGLDKFHDYYEDIYEERWPKLCLALTDHPKKIIRSCFGRNPFENEESLEPGIKWFRPQDHELIQAHPESYYVMDYASYLCAKQLPIKQSDAVLDMCSAPGGKSLILAESLGNNGFLVCNEISKNRRERLKSVLRQYHVDKMNFELTVTGKDGIRFGVTEKEKYDKILLDAPCSSEAHLLQNPKHLKEWSPKRTKKLASLQYGLICSALLALKKGGEMIYSTCSISPLENDLNIKKLIKKKADQFDIVVPSQEVLKLGERTEYGVQFLPDQSNGIGPIYFCHLRRV